MLLLYIKKNFSPIASSLLILLFVYAATSKLLDMQKFHVQLGQSPLLNGFEDWFIWIVPSTEIIISLMLAYSRSRLTALYGSFSLLVMFTVYIIVITRFSDYVPCACGGILQHMNWTQHFYFNLIFILISLLAIIFYNEPVNENT